MDKSEVMEVIEEKSGPSVKKIRVKSRTIDILEVEEKVEEKPEEDSSIFPLVRIKRLMQVGTDEIIRSETLKIMSRAAELFLQDFSRKAYQFTKSKNKKTLVLADAVEAVSTNENLAFIKDSGILNNFVIGSDQRGESSHNVDSSSHKPSSLNPEAPVPEIESNKTEFSSSIKTRNSKFPESTDISIEQVAQVMPINQATLSSQICLNQVLSSDKPEYPESLHKGSHANEDIDMDSCNNEVIDVDMQESGFGSDPLDLPCSHFK